MAKFNLTDVSFTCPSCGHVNPIIAAGRLDIAEVSCTACGHQVRDHFRSGKAGANDAPDASV